MWFLICVHDRERPVEPVVGLERGVDVLGRHAVGDQGPFEDHARVAPQTALAGERIDVEEIGKGGGRALAYRLGIVGHHRRPQGLANAARGERAGDEIVRRRCAVVTRRQGAVVDLLEQALAAASDQVREYEVHHVPGHVLGLDLFANLFQSAVVGFHPHPLAAERAVGLHIRQHLASGVGAAPGDDGQLLRRWRDLALSRLVPGKCGDRCQQGERHGENYDPSTRRHLRFPPCSSPKCSHRVVTQRGMSPFKLVPSGALPSGGMGTALGSSCRDLMMPKVIMSMTMLTGRAAAMEAV